MKTDKVFEALKMLSAGSYYCGDLHSWGPGTRDCYVLHLVLRGKGYFVSAGKKTEVCAGQSFLIYPNTTVHYYPDSNDPWEYTWVDFEGSECEALLGMTAFSEKNAVTHEFTDELKPLFAKAVAVAMEKHIYDDVCRKGLLYEIFSVYIKNFPGNHITEPLDFGETVAEYIRINFHKASLTVDGIAKNMNISRATLYRNFKNTFGIAPTEYLINTRINKACGMLSSTDLPIKTISFSVGYSDQLYFSKAFKNCMGMSPEQYRKNCRKTDKQL